MFPLIIDYNQSFDDLVKKVKFDWKSDYATSENFPFEAKKEIKTINVELLGFDEYKTAEEVEKYCKENNYELLGTRELLAFAAQYPDEQKKNWIVELRDSWQDPDRDVCVLCLDRDSSLRDLDMCLFEKRFDPACQFLVSRKSSDTLTLGSSGSRPLGILASDKKKGEIITEGDLLHNCPTCHRPLVEGDNE